MKARELLQAAMSCLEIMREAGAEDPRISIGAGLPTALVRAIAAEAGVEVKERPFEGRERLVSVSILPHGFCGGEVCAQGTERIVPSPEVYEAALDRYRRGDDSARAELCRMAGVVT